MERCRAERNPEERRKQMKETMKVGSWRNAKPDNEQKMSGFLAKIQIEVTTEEEHKF